MSVKQFAKFDRFNRGLPWGSLFVWHNTVVISLYLLGAGRIVLEGVPSLWVLLALAVAVPVLLLEIFIFRAFLEMGALLQRLVSLEVAKS